MTSSAIVASGLERRFGANDAVAGIDLDIVPGEVYGFLGPNGAGKSTTVRMLCTLLTPTGGTASVAGFDVARNPEEVRLRIGVALQEAALDPKQTGRELLRLQARLYGLRKAEVTHRLGQLAEMVDLGDALDDRIGTYSGGMKRRLDLAAALVHSPEVLFLDEPTTGLDPVSRNRVWDEVRRLNRELGVTIFLTTQYLEEADALAERIGIIVAGSIAAEGSPSALKRRIGTDVIVVRIEGEPDEARRAIEGTPGVESVEVHGDEITIAAEDGSALVSPVAVALDGCAVKVRDLTLRTPTLDDVFLALTGDRFRADADAEAEAEAEARAADATDTADATGTAERQRADR
ncbi:ATP-binding cassette domain-containing protein [Iamia sp.]|uniref:ATP-binding cassette domain-containing protein n=1 Tax=Iamia sp. TaxID=2722710 RepID=UPI002C213DB0|nr:ATP-binding cassette domain-containing protein [Iamia sp.]HXH56307.1 ATP-binding cassette domain-containing protein [Iamia sp.]